MTGPNLAVSSAAKIVRRPENGFLLLEYGSNRSAKILFILFYSPSKREKKISYYTKVEDIFFSPAVHLYMQECRKNQ